MPKRKVTGGFFVYIDAAGAPVRAWNGDVIDVSAAEAARGDEDKSLGDVDSSVVSDVVDAGPIPEEPVEQAPAPAKRGPGRPRKTDQ